MRIGDVKPARGDKRLGEVVREGQGYPFLQHVIMMMMMMMMPIIRVHYCTSLINIPASFCNLRPGSVQCVDSSG